MAFRLAMFLSSVREGRMADRVAPFITKKIKSRGHTLTVFDPLHMNFPMLKKPLHFHGPNETPPAWLVEYNKTIEEADGYVIISAEYNRCIPPALTNMLDHFPMKSFQCKPASIIVYTLGPLGATQSAMQLRILLGELGMVTPQFIYSIPFVDQVFSEDGKPLSDRAESGVDKALKELEWYCAALKAHRDKFGVSQ